MYAAMTWDTIHVYMFTYFCFSCASIFSVECEVIVNAANSKPFHGGGSKSTLQSICLFTITDDCLVTGIIHNKAGALLDRDCSLFSDQEHRTLEPSHCLATDGSSLSDISINVLLMLH